MLHEELKISLRWDRTAPLWMAAVLLAMTWASETVASPDQTRHLADAQVATTAFNLGADEVETLVPRPGGSAKSMQLAQATRSDIGAQQLSEPQRDWATSLSCELGNARRDIALLQRLEQEHDRAEELLKSLEDARREVETQKASAAKAVDDASRPKQASQPNQAGESGIAELQASLQQERERSARQEQDLVAARRDIETQTALATKAGEEASELKHAWESNALELRKALQQESDRSARLEQDLLAARRDTETQTALATKAGEEASELKHTSESNALELRKALQQESDRSARLEQDLAAARHDVESQTALAAKAKSELLRQSMQKERDRAEVPSQDFSLTRSAIYAYEAQTLKAGSDSAELNLAAANAVPLPTQDARDRMERLQQELAVARREAATQTALAAKASEEASRLKAAGESDAAELQKSAQQERERTGQLEQALAAARRDIDAQTALAAKAGDEVARLTQAAKADAEEQKRSIQKEHERADALAQDLSMARSKIYAYEAQAAQASEEAAQLRRAASDAASLEQSQQREHERAEQLSQDLAKTSRELDAQTKLASKASEEVTRTKQAAERGSAELQSLLQRERERADGLERDLALARQDHGAVVAKAPYAASPPATTGKAGREEPASAPARPIQNRPVQDRAVQDVAVQDKPVEDQAIAARSQADAQVHPSDGVQAVKLIARASALLEQGNIGAARIVLERAAELGSAQASFLLAETYDPLILPNFGTYGTQGDPTKAQTLYARAEAGGIKEAKTRAEALRR
ncbi:hypothetical protein SAMN05216525_105157 [Bradyrhizobium sp. Gha]|nr:hypothetical protein SAMN05216525_105157 [Bradyrhizobium sp. Gha]